MAVPNPTPPLPGRFIINPPPKDRCCQSCGLSAEETGPFLDEGGAPVEPVRHLVKDWREIARPLSDEEKARAVALYEKPAAGLTEEERHLLNRDEFASTIEPVWSCQTCLSMGDDLYYRPREEKASIVREVLARASQ